MDSSRLGLAVRRTRAYETEADVQRGLRIGGSHGPLNFAANVVNLDDDRRTVALAIGWGFQVPDASIRRRETARSPCRADVNVCSRHVVRSVESKKALALAK